MYKRQIYKGAYFTNNKLTHFILDTKRKEKTTFIYAIESDENLNVSGENKIVDEEFSKIANSMGTRNISPDSTKVLIYHNRVSRKNPQQLVYKVYDSKFTKVINQGAAVLPIKNKDFSTEKVFVDNFGNVYVNTRITKAKKDRGRNQSNYYYKLIVFDTSGNTKEFDFDYPNSEISYIDFIPTKNNTLFCSGFLNDSGVSYKKSNISDSMFFSELNCKTLTIEESKKIDVKGLYPEKSKKEDIVPYKIREIYEKSDGGYSIVAEQYKLTISVYTNANGGTSYKYKYYYCDVACIQTDKNLNVLSVSKIPKYQLNASNPSIVTTFKNDKTYIVYEDLTRNLNSSGDDDLKRSSKKAFKSSNSNSLFLLTVNSNGETKKEIIYNYKNSRIRNYILGSHSSKDGEIILSAYNRIGVLNFK